MTAIRLKLLAFAVASGLASPMAFGLGAMARDPLPSVDQIGVSKVDAIEQISDGSSEIIAPVRTEPRQPVTSLRPTPSERIPGAAQLTAETGLARASTQVSTGDRSSAGTAPLSRPSEGRKAGAVDRLAGNDRCDPSYRDASTAKACALVIERRAAEFAAREPSPLSPEQRILIEQQRRASAFDARSASRRLANSGTGSDSPELQGIASLVLHAPPEAAKGPKPIDDQDGLDATAAIVNGVLGQILAPPPQ